MPSSWKASGQYYETCSCDFVCPCILGQMAVQPSKGTCTFAMAFKIEKGTYGMCRDCGEPIAPARLNAIPWTRVCITCKEKQNS